MTDSMEARSRSKTSMQGVDEDNIVTIPLERLEVQLGASPEGLSQGEAEKRIEVDVNHRAKNSAASGYH